MKRQYLGKLIFSATGLRKMANYLQRETKTKGDVKVKTYICINPPDKEGKIIKVKTIGIEL